MVNGSGAFGDPFQGTGTVTDAQTFGNAYITMAGPVTSFTVEYWNTQANYSSSIDGDQRVFLSDFSFNYPAC